MVNSPFDDSWKCRVYEGALLFDLRLTTVQLDQMACHAAELVSWNQKFNLTAIVDPEKIATKHFIDSLALISQIPDRAHVLDIGSGGGFPGVVIGIVRPDTSLLMIDASRKKISFLKHIIRTIGLTGIDAVHSRVEALQSDKQYHHCFDSVVSRAFSSLDTFSSVALSFVKKNGAILAMKGKLSEAELQLPDTVRVSIQTIAYQLPFEHHERSIIRMVPVY